MTQSNRSVVTYTTQEPFLDAFLYYCGSNYVSLATPAGMATHSYAGYGDLTYWTGLMNSDFPTQTVWVTEFNPSGISGGISSSAQVLANLIPSVDYCERTPWIEGYSWFMSRITGDPYDSLLTSTSGVLTAAGQAYVQMPVHETNLFYRIPGQLQADAICHHEPNEHRANDRHERTCRHDNRGGRGKLEL